MGMQTVRQSNKFILAAGVLWLFIGFSCNFNTVYQQTTDIKDGKWDKNNSLKFEIPMTDTLGGYNILFNIRNNNEYPFSNLYLFVKTWSPTGVSRTDTLEYTLADEDGKWLGKGIGGIWQKEYPYRRNIRFPEPGIYRIEVIQAMRRNQLEGIIDFGVRVEKYRP